MRDCLQSQGCETWSTHNATQGNYWLNWTDGKLEETSCLLGGESRFLSWGLTFTNREVSVGFYLYRPGEERGNPSPLDWLLHFMEDTPIDQLEPDKYRIVDRGYGWHRIYYQALLPEDEFAGMSVSEGRTKCCGSFGTSCVRTRRTTGALTTTFGASPSTPAFRHPCGSRRHSDDVNRTLDRPRRQAPAATRFHACPFPDPRQPPRRSGRAQPLCGTRVEEARLRGLAPGRVRRPLLVPVAVRLQSPSLFQPGCSRPRGACTAAMAGRGSSTAPAGTGSARRVTVGEPTVRAAPSSHKDADGAFTHPQQTPRGEAAHPRGALCTSMPTGSITCQCRPRLSPDCRLRML